VIVRLVAVDELLKVVGERGERMVGEYNAERAP